MSLLCTEQWCHVQGHALRAAINTPIQGSAADVATAAMLSIDACQELRELGWKMLLQVSLSPVKVLRMHACISADTRPDVCIVLFVCQDWQP